MCKKINQSLSAVLVRFSVHCFHHLLTKHNVFFLLLPVAFSFFPFLSLCVFIHLSALPSICQSIHLSSSTCHFSCHLNHPSIRPSVFQATRSFTFQCNPYSFICPSCLLCTVTLLWSRLLSADFWWQIWSREWLNLRYPHMLLHTDKAKHTCAPRNTQIHTETCCFPWPYVPVVFSLHARWAVAL